MSGDTLIDPCKHAEQHVQEYLDGMLCSEVAATVEAHLAVCEHCARAYAFEQRFRRYVKHCCGGVADEDRCRAEFRQKLEECCRNVRTTGAAPQAEA